MTRFHRLSARLDENARREGLEKTLDVLSALNGQPRDVREVAARAGVPDDENGDGLRSVSRRLAHLVKHHAALEVLERVGDDPPAGTITRSVWDAIDDTPTPLLIVAARLHRPVSWVRRKINEHAQNRASSAAQFGVAMRRAWTITPLGVDVLAENS